MLTPRITFCQALIEIYFEHELIKLRHHVLEYSRPQITTTITAFHLAAGNLIWFQIEDEMRSKKWDTPTILAAVENLIK